MKILAIDLPSHGFRSNLSIVNLNPMTFKDMIDYSNNSSKDKLTQLKVDIDLLKKDTPNILELNYFDFESVLLLKKLISVTSVPKVRLECTCQYSDCKAINFVELGVDELHYTNFDADLVSKISSIILGGSKVNVKVPKLADVDKLLTLLQHTRTDIEFDLFRTMTFIDLGKRPNEVVRLVNNATLDEISLLIHLRNLFVGNSKTIEFTCEKCMRKESVTITNIVTDMFRLLQLNESIDKSKISLSE